MKKKQNPSLPSKDYDKVKRTGKPTVIKESGRERTLKSDKPLVGKDSSTKISSSNKQTKSNYDKHTSATDTAPPPPKPRKSKK